MAQLPCIGLSWPLPTRPPFWEWRSPSTFTTATGTWKIFEWKKLPMGTMTFFGREKMVSKEIAAIGNWFCLPIHECSVDFQRYMSRYKKKSPMDPKKIDPNSFKTEALSDLVGLLLLVVTFGLFGAGIGPRKEKTKHQHWQFWGHVSLFWGWLSDPLKGY